MDLTPVSGVPASSEASTGAWGRPHNVAQAAKQFEALLIGQMLRMAHSDEDGWLGSGGDASSSSAMDVAEQFLAQALSDHGGIGLAKVVQKGLEKK